MNINQSKKIKISKNIIDVGVDKWRVTDSSSIIATTGLESCVAVIVVLVDRVYLFHYVSSHSPGYLDRDKIFAKIKPKAQKVILIPGPTCPQHKLDSLMLYFDNAEIKLPFIIYEEDRYDGCFFKTMGGIAYDFEKDTFYGFDNYPIESLHEYLDNFVNTNIGILNEGDIVFRFDIEGIENYGQSL